MDSDLKVAERVYSNILEQNIHNMNDLMNIGKVNPDIILPEKGMNILHLAVGIDPIEYAENVTQLLLNYGCNPNEGSNELMTPLHIACAWGRLSIVEILLNNGADPYIRDNDNKIPLDYATENGHLDVIECLFDYYQNDDECSNSSESYVLKLDRITIENGALKGEYRTLNNDKLNLTVSEDDDELNNSIVSCIFNEQTEKNLSNDSLSIMNSKETICNNNSTNSSNGTKYSDYHSCNDASLITDNSCKSLENGSNEESLLTGIATLKFTRNDDNLYSVFHDSNDYKIESSIIENSDSKQENAFPNSPVPFPHKNYCSKTTLNSKKCSINDNDQVKTPLPDFNLQNMKNEKNSLFPAYLNLTENISAIDVTSQLPNADNTKNIIEEYKYEDKQAGIVLIEKRILSTSNLLNSYALNNSEPVSRTSSVSSVPMSVDYDTDGLRKELLQFGISPGPITLSTKKVYLNKLYRLKKETPQKAVVCQDKVKGKTYTIELEKSLRDFSWTANLSLFMELEKKIVQQFDQPDPRKRWREGILKSSFTYLLMDPRLTDNLPGRADTVSKQELWKSFLDSIFYVGKGKRSRPYSHLYQAVSLYNAGQLISSDKKVQYILDIWKENLGVVCLHIFQNVIPAEAYTREAAMIEVLGLKNLKNIKPGNYYGVSSTWSFKEKKHLGMYLLYRAMLILLNEGERQLKPVDIV